MQRMELREQSRITGTGAGAHAMVAKDIDMNYAPTAGRCGARS